MGETENCGSGNGSINENKIIIQNLFNDNKETPSRVPFTIEFQQQPICSLPKYVNIAVKEPHKHKEIEAAYVLQY